jgi:hypothetical protein
MLIIHSVFYWEILLGPIHVSIRAQKKKSPINVVYLLRVVSKNIENGECIKYY